MKKSLLFALSAALFATSCFKDDDGHKLDLPESYYFATVMEVGVDPTAVVEDGDADADDTFDAEIYFLLDSKETFVVTKNISRTDLDDLEIGDRVVTGVTLAKCADDSYDYTAKLYDVIDVAVGENVTVTNEEESEALEDDRFSYIATDITLTKGFLNLFVGIQTEDLDAVKFYLVDNQFDEPLAEDDDYLYLELRYDSTGKQGAGLLYKGYLSFDMETYREQLADKDGVILRAKTDKSGEFTVKVDSDELFDAEVVE